ncbi:MAG TPA: hypothetical protein VKY26_03920, partial [Actinomycetota bacterium]|nr:hypothetical protein [Actinomycetota bacterium]
MKNDPARRRWALAVLVIVAAVLVANLIRLTGSTPLDQRARLSSPGKPGQLPGQATIDPNDGYTALALGHLAAEDWLHGHLPYWNPYEGVGTPLAGEMQSAAMFPLVPLLALPQGLLWMHVLLELLAALATWLLLKRLGLAETVATLGGILFAFSGTFAWLSNAAVNPIAFLPWLLLGIEAVRGGRRGGIVLTASAVALSLYAGFPEVAFLDTLFALGWAAIRLPARGARGRFAARSLLGGVLGVALAAPILVAFADYLRVGFTGDHAAGIGSASLEPIAVSALAVPYLFGPVYAFFFQDQRIAAFWASVGGYLSSTSVVLALSALFSPRRRRLKLYLAVWSLLACLKIYGFPFVGRAIDLIPGIEATAFDRYAIVTVEFAVILLAVLALDDLNTRQLVIVGAGVAVVLALLGAAALPVIR